MDTRERRTRERLYEQEQVSVRYRLVPTPRFSPIQSLPVPGPNGGSSPG